MIKGFHRNGFIGMLRPHLIRHEGLWHAYYRQTMSISYSASDACRLALGLIPTTPRWVDGRQQ